MHNFLSMRRLYSIPSEKSFFLHTNFNRLEYSECLQFLQGDYLIILSRHSEGILQGCKVTDEKAIGLIAETAVEFSSKEEATNWLTNGKPSSESSRKIAVDEKEQISSDATASDGRPRPKLRKRVSFEENLRPSGLSSK